MNNFFIIFIIIASTLLFSFSKKKDKLITEVSFKDLNPDDFEAGVPESFNVLVKEIRALGLNIELN